MPPVPSLNVRSRKPRGGPLRLPAGGRRGRIPVWPLASVSPAELKLWRELWRTPQAVAWQRLGFTRVVARYARVLLVAEAGMEKEPMGEARQLEDRLGLTPKAMRTLLWTVEEETPEEDAVVVDASRWQRGA